MRRGRLAVFLVLSMALAGCLGPTTASWGKGGGEIHVEVTEDSTVIRTGLGPDIQTFDDLQAVGCATESGELGTNTTTPLRFPGYLASSNFYSSHSALGGANGLDYAVSASVAIQSMSLDAVKTMPEGEGPRVEVKNWDMPLNPETGSGTVDLDEIDRDSDSQWYILGLIPTSENIHNGMVSLAEWHQPVSISGYLVQGNSTGNAPGYYNSQTAESDCRLSIGTSNSERIFVLVTSIELKNGAVVSSDGESDDEWVYGDVPVFGRAGFILFFLVVGVGGSVGAFILSKMFVLQGAKSTMKTLLGKSGMDAIKQVKKDVKSAKSAGLSSPSDRKKEMRKQAPKAAPEKKKKSSEPALAGFDLDSVLSSAPSTSQNTEFGGKGSSVVMTEESKQMDRELKEQSPEPVSSVPSSIRSTVPPRQTSSNVSSSVSSPSQASEHYSSSAPASTKKSTKGPPKRKTVRKRRATVKQSEPEEQPQPKQTARETYSEPEEDFSDFSF